MLGALLICLFVSRGYTQDIQQLSENKKPRIDAFRIHEKIVIDGALNEPGWQNCPIEENFIESYPVEGKTPKFPTEVRVMYDDVNLYISAVCFFGGRKKDLQVVNMSRDFSYSDNELFNVMLGTFNDKRMPVLSFSVTPYSTQLDILYSGTGGYDYNWNALWNSKCSIRDSSWIAEIEIPFSSLRYPPENNSWGINFTRNNRNTGEISGWSLWPQAFSASRLEYGGLLVNIHPPKPKLNIRFQPYSLAKLSSGNKLKAQSGGDLKWAVNTNTVIDATVNTDFAQADADKQVINLGRSSVFFPEKRQFFLENGGLFSIGQNGIVQPFFSRKIGLGNDGAILPIEAGIRLINQTDKQSIGFLFIKQGSDSNNNSSLFSAFRYKKNIGKNLQVGAMEIIHFTEKNKGISSSFNPVSSIDFFWQSNPNMYLRSMLAYSTNSGTHDQGLVSLTEWNFSNNFITAGIFETVATKGYSSEAGFLAREDFINTQPSIQLTIHKPWFPKAVAFYTPLISADIYHKASTKTFQEASIIASPVNFVFKDLSLFAINLYASFQNLSETFSPVNGVTIDKGQYSYLRYELSGQTNQAAHFGAGATISTGDYYNRRLHSFQISLKATPIPKIAFTLNYNRDKFIYQDNEKSIATQLIILKALIALNANLQLSSLYQYNTDTKTNGVNIRFSWQYKPLSFLYFVYNSVNYYGYPFNNFNNIKNSILKINYLYQF